MKTEISIDEVINLLETYRTVIWERHLDEWAAHKECTEPEEALDWADHAGRSLALTQVYNELITIEGKIRDKQFEDEKL